ncbi:MAG TPA: M56 family metallopeptidase [Candidatus Aquilonibacter sp.]|nr:M56 family metallopeptidase [Candidatus Aquilonibacter sp.]
MSADLSSLTPVANHLWQSTVLVGMIWLVTLGLKRNRAAVRYWLWFAASVKFLVPFSLLVVLGSRLSWQTAAPIAQPQWSFVVDNAIQPFAASTASTQALSPHASFTLAPILIGVWLCGVAVGVAFWLKFWMQMRRIRRNATTLSLGLPIPVLSSPSQIEPGVFGIFRPVLLLPEGIESRLTPAQLDAIVAHEMAHVRRRDNLTAAIHMIAEVVFWFFPVVYWLRARLIEERENACDEDVLRLGSEAESYAEGIIEVCKSYTESPAACISGISGSDLKKRIIGIVTPRFGENLTLARRLLLSTFGIAAVAAPIVFGIVIAPLLHAQSASADWEKAAGNRIFFDAASVKRNTSGDFGGHTNVPMAGDRFTPTGGLFSVTDYPLGTIISFAYKLTGAQTTAVQHELPKWALVDRYDIEARASGNPTKDQYRLMVQSLLETRFKLSVHYEDRETPVLALELSKAGKLGPKLREHPADAPCSKTVTDAARQTPIKPDGYPATCGYLSYEPSHAPGEFRVGASGVTIGQMGSFFSSSEVFGTYPRPVIDKTGLAGTYDFVVEFSSDMPPQDAPYPQDPNGPSFITALKNQLGLKLRSLNAPISFLVIDRIEEPTPN